MAWEDYKQEYTGWFDIDRIRVSPAAQELLDAASFASMLQAHRDTLWTGSSAVGFVNEVSLRFGGPILSNPMVDNQEMYLLTEPGGATYIMLATPGDRDAYYTGETDDWGPPIFPVPS